jgi:hypothetical protein
MALALFDQVQHRRDWGLKMGHSLVAGGVKGNMICLSGGVPSAGAGTVGVEAENLFSSFIARAGHELRCCVALLMRGAVGLPERCSLCGNLVANTVLSLGSSTSHSWCGLDYAKIVALIRGTDPACRSCMNLHATTARRLMI